MSVEDPQIGETWSFGEEEAVILSRSPDRTQLLSRSGRRLHMPLRSLQLMGTLRHEVPEIFLCDICNDITFFRVSIRDQPIRRLCENHIPLGAPILFPHDHASDDLAREVICPLCSNPTDHTPQLKTLQDENEEGVEYCQLVCVHCSARWISLAGQGTGTAGYFFAETIPVLVDNLKEAQLGQLTVQVGFSAINSIRRTVGFARGEHLQGIPLIESETIGSDTVLITFQPKLSEPTEVPPPKVPKVNSLWRLKSSGYILAVQKATDVEVTLEYHHKRESLLQNFDDLEPYTLPLTDFYTDYEQVESSFSEEITIPSTPLSYLETFAKNSVWRLRGNSARTRCIIKEVITDWPNLPIIQYELRRHIEDVDRIRNTVMSLERFENYWVKNEGNSPNVDSFWRSLDDSRTLVRVLHPTNPNTVRFITLDGRIAEVLPSTLQYCYEELPAPYQSYWVKNGILFRSVEIKGTEFLTAQVVLEDENQQTSKVPYLDLLSNYNPMYFSERSVQKDVPLFFGVKWYKEDEFVTLLDFGTAEATEYVRFQKGDQTLMKGTHLFLEEYQPPPAPCQVGEEWKCDGKVWVIQHINLQDLTISASINSGDQRKGALDIPLLYRTTFEEFTKEFKKLERKTLFELLDE